MNSPLLLLLLQAGRVKDVLGQQMQEQEHAMRAEHQLAVAGIRNKEVSVKAAMAQVAWARAARRAISSRLQCRRGSKKMLNECGNTIACRTVVEVAGIHQRAGATLPVPVPVPRG
jgi:hypothetical protein